VVGSTSHWRENSQIGLNQLRLAIPPLPWRDKESVKAALVRWGILPHCPSIHQASALDGSVHAMLARGITSARCNRVAHNLLGAGCSMLQCNLTELAHVSPARTRRLKSMRHKLVCVWTMAQSFFSAPWTPTRRGLCKV